MLSLSNALARCGMGLSVWVGPSNSFIILFSHFHISSLFTSIWVVRNQVLCRLCKLRKSTVCSTYTPFVNYTIFHSYLKKQTFILFSFISSDSIRFCNAPILIRYSSNRFSTVEKISSVEWRNFCNEWMIDMIPSSLDESWLTKMHFAIENVTLFWLSPS